MSMKRKISVRKILQTLVTVLVVAGCVTAIMSASKMQDSRKIKGLDIRIRNDQYHFIDKQQVKTMLFSSEMNLAKTNLKKLNTHLIEKVMDENPWVADAQVYVDNAKVMHIYLTQRVPVARLFDQSGNSYYLDRSLKAMPLSDNYIHYTTVVTNVPVFNNDSTGRALDTAMKAQILSLVKFIGKDTFWNAQVSQVVVTDDRTFELVPVLGNQKIIFGDTSRMQEKFDNLFAFYKRVLNRVGWDKYETLDLRFAGQVVAAPSLPWKVPVDKSLSNMNWVKSIIGNEANVTNPDTSATPMVTVAALKAETNKLDDKPAATDVVIKQQPVAAKVQPVVPKPQPVALHQVKPVVASAVKPAIKVPVKHAVVAPKPKVAPALKKHILVAAKPKAKIEPKAKHIAAPPKRSIIKKAESNNKKEQPTPKYIYQGNNNH